MASAPGPATPAAGIDQFLQPQSMVTPGLLGTVAMFGTNTLCEAFPGVAPVHVALGLSFFFGVVTIVKTTTLIEKAVYYVVNSLIILSMAFGTNSIGRQTTGHVASLDRGISIAAFNPFPPAYAQTQGTSPSQGFFRPWGFSPPAVQTAPVTAPTPADVPASVVPYRIVSRTGGSCTTVFLPRNDPNALADLRAKLSVDASDIVEGTCPPK